MNNNRKLSRDGARMYSNIRRYLGDKAINRYELKKVKSDVFEMIYEAETRGETVFNVFPDGGKAFCDDVVKNCLHKKWYEVLLEALFCASALLAIFTIITVLGDVIYPDEGESVSGMYLTVKEYTLIGPLTGGAIGAVFGIFFNRNVFSDKRRKTLMCVIAFVALAAFVIVAVIVLNVVLGERTIVFNWVAVAVPATALAIIFWSFILIIAKRNFKLKI